MQIDAADVPRLARRWLADPRRKRSRMPTAITSVPMSAWCWPSGVLLRGRTERRRRRAPAWWPSVAPASRPGSAARRRGVDGWSVSAIRIGAADRRRPASANRWRRPASARWRAASSPARRRRRVDRCAPIGMPLRLRRRVSRGRRGRGRRGRGHRPAVPEPASIDASTTVDGTPPHGPPSTTSATGAGERTGGLERRRRRRLAVAVGARGGDRADAPGEGPHEAVVRAADADGLRRAAEVELAAPTRCGSGRA